MNHSPSSFHTTRWTLVREAGGDSTRAREALRELCDAYYPPVVAFLRLQGRDDETARELAHGFFAKLLAGGLHGEPSAGQGRFRNYLLGAVKHFLANTRRDAARQKRGGDLAMVPLDGDTACPGAQIAAPAGLPADLLFDREWALAILHRSLGLLEREQSGAGPGPHFADLRPWLTPAPPPEPQADCARRLGLGEGALKVAIHRLRKRFRELVRAEVLATLADPADLDDEMRHLVEVLASGT